MSEYKMIKRLGLQLYAPHGALDRKKFICDIDDLEEILQRGHKTGTDTIQLKLEPDRTPVSKEDLLFYLRLLEHPAKEELIRRIEDAGVKN